MIRAVHLKQPEYEDYVRDHAELLCEFYGEKLVALAIFGSIARGHAQNTSDLDVLIVLKDAPIYLNQRTEGLTEFLLKLEHYESYKKLKASGRSTATMHCVFTMKEIENHPPILLDIIDDGIILYDIEAFLENELKLFIVSACEEILRKFLNKQVYGEKVNEERREPT